jgi:hypothetical protein
VEDLPSDRSRDRRGNNQGDKKGTLSLMTKKIRKTMEVSEDASSSTLSAKSANPASFSDTSTYAALRFWVIDGECKKCFVPFRSAVVLLYCAYLFQEDLNDCRRK